MNIYRKKERKKEWKKEWKKDKDNVTIIIKTSIEVPNSKRTRQKWWGLHVNYSPKNNGMKDWSLPTPCYGNLYASGRELKFFVILYE